MVWIVIGIASLALLGALILMVVVMLVKGPLFRRVLSEAHFVECARGAWNAARRACRKREDPGSAGEENTGGDEEEFTSSEGVVLHYSIRKGEGDEAGQFVHHYSVRMNRGYTPHAIGGTFVAWVALILEVGLAMGWVGITPDRVHHAEFALDGDEQREFEKGDCVVPSEAEFRLLLTESRALRDSLDWEAIGECGPGGSEVA